MPCLLIQREGKPSLILLLRKRWLGCCCGLMVAAPLVAGLWLGHRFGPSLSEQPQPQGTPEVEQPVAAGQEAAAEQAADEQERQLEALGTDLLELRRRLQEVGLEIDSDAFPSEAVGGGQGGPWLEPTQLDSTLQQTVELGEILIDRRRQLQHRLATRMDLEPPLATLPLGSPLAMPYRFTSGFGLRIDPWLHRTAMHNGVDLAAPWGASVYANAPGEVSSCFWNGSYGLMLELDHGNGLYGRYAHLSDCLVGSGDRVERGSLIGRVGSSGRSTGPHLHYEILVDGEQVDPLPFLRVL